MSMRYLLGWRASSMMAARWWVSGEGGRKGRGGRTDDVGALLGHVDQVATRSVGELDGVDGSLLQSSISSAPCLRPPEERTHGSNDISDVRDRGSAGGSDVEDLLSGCNVDVVESTKDTSGQLGAEGVPDAVLDLLGGEVGVGVGGFDGDALLAVDRVAGNEVAGDEEVLLALVVQACELERGGLGKGRERTLATKTPG